MLLINIGCGSVFHPAWVNIDTNPSDPSIRRWDVRYGLPFGDGGADVCYASHVLEHLTPDAAEQLLSECHRVLRPGGIVRVAVPDLETIVLYYLQLLERADRGEPEAEADYDWIMLELYDQTVRTRCGGQMAHYLSRPDMPNKDFVRSRVGMEAQADMQRSGITGFEWLMKKVKSLSAQKARYLLARRTVEGLAGIVGGTSMRNAVREGIFRNSGEVHKWMYDRFSLKRLLQRSRFTNVQVCSATESGISNFNSYQLDAIDGRVRKPDSLFLEARKS